MAAVAGLSGDTRRQSPPRRDDAADDRSARPHDLLDRHRRRRGRLWPGHGLSRDCRWQGIDHAAAGRPDPPQHAGASVAMGDASMISRGSTRQTPNSVSAARARLLDEMKKAGVSDPAVPAAVAKVPRERFVDDALKNRA